MENFFFIVYKLYASKTCNGYAGIIYDWYHPSTGEIVRCLRRKTKDFSYRPNYLRYQIRECSSFPSEIAHNYNITYKLLYSR